MDGCGRIQIMLFNPVMPGDGLKYHFEERCYTVEVYIFSRHAYKTPRPWTQQHSMTKSCNLSHQQIGFGKLLTISDCEGNLTNWGRKHAAHAH